MTPLGPRERLWVALSDLFRDTELEPHDFDHIAEAIRAAGLDAAAAERVLLRDVAPAFGPNLLSVAGEWAGWPDDSVVQAVQAHLARRHGWLSRAGAALGAQAVRNTVYRWLLRDDWQQVRRRLERSSD